VGHKSNAAEIWVSFHLRFTYVTFLAFLLPILFVLFGAAFDFHSVCVKHTQCGTAAIEADLLIMCHAPHALCPLPPPVKCWPLMAKTVNRQPYEMACQVPTKAELLFILTFCRAWPNARMAPTLLALP